MKMGEQKGTEYRVGDTHSVGPETYIWTRSILRLDRCGRKRNDGNGDHDRLFARWLVEKGRKKKSKIACGCDINLIYCCNR